MSYILKNIKYGGYLKYWKQYRYNHLVFNEWEASVFNLTEAKRRLNTFKHKENWEIVKYAEDNR